MKFSLLFLVFFVMFSQLAPAQGFSPKSLELSLSEGMSYFSNKSFQIGSPQSSTPIDGVMKLKGNNGHEARLNFLTTNRLGAEAFYHYEVTSVVFARSTPPADSLSIPLQIHHFGVNILYYVTGKTTAKWRPFVSFGGGTLLFRPTGAGQDIATDPLRGNLSSFIESSRPSFDYGLGVKRSFGKTFGARFDAGSAIASVPTFGLPQTSDLPNQSVLPIGGRTNNIHASVGIILYLGK